MPGYPEFGGGTVTTQQVLDIMGDVPDITMYAAPTGSDLNDGLSLAGAKYLGYEAAAALIAAGGGTLVLADQTVWGGPVPGQAMWFRGDGLPVPGYLNFNVPLQIVGLPKSSQTLFQRGPAANIVCGTQGDRRFPGLHFVATNRPVPVVGIGFQGLLDVPYRYNWDYERLDNGGINYCTITGATRAAGSTTFTVTLPTGLNIVSAARVSNVVTLVCSKSAANKMPWMIGAPIRVTSSDPGFPSVDTVVTGAINGSTTTTITYTQSGSDDTAGAIGTVKTHSCKANEWLDIFSDDSEFPTSMYRVTSVTIDTVTVQDIYGYSPRSASASGGAIGTLVHQNRSIYNGTQGMSLINCGGNCPSQDERFTSGPFLDVGASSASNLLVKDCFLQGISLPGGYSSPKLHLERSAAIFGFGSPGCGLTVIDCCSSDGGIVHQASGTDDLTLEYFVMDTGNGFPPPGVYVTQGDPFMSIDIDTVVVADDELNTPAVIIPITCDPLRVFVRRPGIGGSKPTTGPGTITWGGTNVWGGHTGNNPWVEEQLGTWADQRITGKHPGALRAMGPVSARFINQIQPEADWFTSGDIDSQTNIEGPDGANTGWAVASSSGGQVILTDYPQAFSGLATGGRVVIGCWVNFDVPFPAPTPIGISSYVANDVLFDNGDDHLSVTVPFNGAGWQFIYASAEVVSVANNRLYAAITVPAGYTLNYWAPICLYVPPSVSDNDFYELLGTLKHQPLYLPKGMTGTMDYQKFIAHGGLGISSAITNVAGVGSGQLTLTGTGTVYEPRYAADGTTIIGWVALLQATVNP